MARMPCTGVLLACNACADGSAWGMSRCTAEVMSSACRMREEHSNVRKCNEEQWLRLGLHTHLGACHGGRWLCMLVPQQQRQPQAATSSMQSTHLATPC